MRKEVNMRKAERKSKTKCNQGEVSEEKKKNIKKETGSRRGDKHNSMTNCTTTQHNNYTITVSAHSNAFLPLLAHTEGPQ